MANPFKSMGGGLGNAGMAKMLEQVQKDMYKKAEEMAEKLDEARIDGSAGGGSVKAQVDGNGHLTALTISPDVMADGDAEMLQDLVLTAVNEALEKAETLRTDEQKKLMPNVPGLNIPGLF